MINMLSDLATNVDVLGIYSVSEAFEYTTLKMASQEALILSYY